MSTNLHNGVSTPSQTASCFPVGYHQLHDDPLFNFEMNRPFSRLRDETMLAEMRSIAPKVWTLADWKREFLPLAEIALTRGETLKAAYYCRLAEFFMLSTDPDKQPTRRRFLSLARTHYRIEASQQLNIPYHDGR